MHNDTTPVVFTRLNSYLADAPKVDLQEVDVKHLDLASLLATASSHAQHRVGAVIAQRRSVISTGFNVMKTHPFQARWNKKSVCLHAEMVAIIDAQKNQEFDPSKATVYVARRSRRKIHGCSYPCDSCWAALSHIGIKTVVCHDENSRPTKIVL